MNFTDFMLNEKVFKAYDVRGVWGRDWNAEGAAQIIRAFVSVFNIHRLVIGYDMRASSLEIVESAKTATRDCGIDVVNIGRVTTPMLYCGVATDNSADGGVMITASHNTGEWNGMKFVRSGAMPVGESSGLLDVKAATLKSLNAFDENKKNVAADWFETCDVKNEYLEKVLSLIRAFAHDPLSERELKISIPIVFDCGNGMAGAILRDVIAAANVRSGAILFEEPDGTFPNHEANPLKHETLATLQKEVVERGAMLGVAFDGDADRVGFVDELGNIVPGDVIGALIAGELLSVGSDAAVLYDLRSRRSVAEYIKERGGMPVMSRVGHAFIKEQMRAANAIAASELSAHYYFRDFFGVECADAAWIIIAEIIQRTEKPLSELAAPFLKRAHSGERNYHVRDREAVFAELEKIFATRALAINRLDGLLFNMGEWWFNVRMSNTEPLVRLSLEAETNEEMERRVAEVAAVIISA